jgi:hypothetical protein
VKTYLQDFQMGDFSEDEVIQIETLLAGINPEQMPTDFGFTQRETCDHNFESLADLLGQPLTDHLASLITELLKRLADADPAKVFKQPNWLEKATGKYLETSLNFLEAGLRIDSLLKEAETAAKRIETLLAEIDKQRYQLRNEIRELRLSVAAGRLYLNRDTKQTLASETCVFDALEERFARRLTNLAALLASHEMTAMQLDLAHTHMSDLLANFYESCHVLLPIWRGHSLGLLLNEKNAPSQVGLAQQAYLALKNNLSHSV